MQPLALTLGEPAGIGPDLALTIWQRRAELDIPPFYILGEPNFLGRRAGDLGLRIPIERASATSAAAVFPSALPVAALGMSISAKPGVPPGARLEVSVSPELAFVYCHTTNQPWQRAVVDHRGYLKFSDKPQTAPVLHFYGPLTMGLRFDHRFKRQSTPADLDVMVGTPGIGPGSFVRFGHEGIPQELRPQIEILWPGNQNGPARLILKKRC